MKFLIFRNPWLRFLLAISWLLLASGAALAADAPYPGTLTIATKHSFDTLMTWLKHAINDNGMGLSAQASASRGAASRGIRIPSNAVLEVFRNDHAVRMLQASVPAGIEAPLRILRTEPRALPTASQARCSRLMATRSSTQCPRNWMGYSRKSFAMQPASNVISESLAP